MEIAAALEQSALGEAMRRSAVFYPAANVGHILAMLVFFATFAIMDVRLLGALRSLPWQRVVAGGRPLAVAAFAVQALTGILLFAADAVAISANPAFRIKLLIIGLGLANFVLLEVLLRRRRRSASESPTALPTGVRLCAAFSLLAWLAAAVCGRLIAYV